MTNSKKELLHEIFRDVADLYSGRMSKDEYMDRYEERKKLIEEQGIQLPLFDKEE